MFCNKCGAQVPNGSPFCTRCGSKMPSNGNPVMNNYNKNVTVSSNAGNGTSQSVYTYSPVNNGSTSKKSGKTIGGMIAVVVVVILCIVIFGGRSAKGVADDYLAACENKDGEAMWDLYPSELQDALIEEGIYDDEEDAIDKLEDECADDRVMLGLRESYDYELDEGNELDEDEIEDLIDLYDDFYDVKLDISAAKEIEIDIDSEDDHAVRDETTIHVMKIGGSWYISRRWVD